MAGKKGITFNMTGGRWFILGLAVVAVFSTFVLYSLHQRSSNGLQAAAKITDNSINKANIAGSTEASPRYVAEVRDTNKVEANVAIQKGQSAFVATPVVDASDGRLIPPQQTQAKSATVNYQSSAAPAPTQNQVVYQRPPVDQAVASQISAIAAAIKAMQEPGSTMVVYTQPQTDSAQQAMQARVAQAAQPTSVPEGDSVIIPAGSLIYGVFSTRMQSDVPGPVLGELVQGKWNGYKVLGQFTPIQDSNLVSIHLNQLIDPSGVAHPIDAYALSPDTTLPAMATQVDRHIFSRAAAFAGAAFLAGLQGYGQALGQSGTTSITSMNGSSVSMPYLTNTQLIEMAAGNSAKNTAGIQTSLNSMIMQPNTITVKEGTPFVLLTVKGADKK